MINRHLPNQYFQKFKHAEPIQHVYIDNFLSKEYADKLNTECLSIPAEQWKVFTRNGSYMEECNKLEYTPVARDFVNHMHSPEMLRWLEEVTGIKHLIPDPYLIGAGYSRSFSGDSLKVHSDFNWNEELQLHRALSLIVYFTPDWKTEYGGALDFYDSECKNVVTSVECLFNRCLLWKYEKRAFHGYTSPLKCPTKISRNSFRLFYYISKSQHDAEDPPHRSLYWYDPITNEPYDKKEFK